MHPECPRHHHHTQRSAHLSCPRRRPHADAPGDCKAVPSRTPCRSSCSGAALGRWNGRHPRNARCRCLPARRS
eukprot:348432-Alexandrium_andersonii.AAC.1